jgi:hypothetical protein
MATDQKGLSLYEIIGAPLKALVEAETYAARATAEFIRDFGFKKEARDDQDDLLDDFGKLRTVTFVQERRGRGGAVEKYRIEVPLLSLIPIPALQIKDAELEFYVKILETIRSKAPAPPVAEPKNVGEQVRGEEEKEGSEESAEAPAKNEKSSFFPESSRVEFMGAMGRSFAGAEAKRSLDMQVRVKINVEQADIPAGMAKLFHIMEQGISGAPVDDKKE